MIEIKQVTKTYADGDALANLTLTIDDGELFVLVGPSGSGKTTLLRSINRLVVPTSGQVFVDGVDVATVDLQDLRRHTGYVLQSGALFPNMTVEQNAQIQMEALGWAPAKMHDRIRQLMHRVDLDPEVFLDRKPSELSGGEAQRVGIVRALAPNPKLVLMDEPFSALDPLSRRQLQSLVRELHRELETTFVFVTHDMREALQLADHLAVIHSGRLQQVGTPADIMAKPANDFVRNFFDDEIARSRYMQQVVASGLGKVAVGDETVTLDGRDTIFDWAAAVQTQPDVVVRVGKTRLVAADLITYMARMTGGDQQ
ncbi:ATP-binding cassette domain-containing protein [Lacticaseibacillus pantheris]|uniref:ATP-binding cassette domain-containing protein n=1 Tax=Lacticaseibacillus pantheris TaxID=171523 RepID=UPI002659476C|nr:ABC transporter ATP-binding protein [Lacticaseibacillus pantheris]WKF85352.1 ABC transporter ATP-binding protein [Lacticaseibacillus pantheris]